MSKSKYTRILTAIRALFCACLLLCFSQACQQPKESDFFTIAVASSLKPCIEELALSLPSLQEKQLRFIAASSGQLYAQMKSGMVFDLYIPAHDKWAPPQDYHPAIPLAQGQLIHVSNPQSLSDKIAIPHPHLAPYGQAAQVALNTTNPEALEKHQVLWATNANQAFFYLHSGHVKEAYTSSTFLEQCNKMGYLCEVLEDNDSSSIIYAMYLRQDHPTQLAEQLKLELSRSQALNILSSYHLKALEGPQRAP